MKLEEFIKEMHDDVDAFHRYWKKQQRGKHSKHFPDKMEAGEWDQQFLIFQGGMK